jgi:TRAP-type mannitol/chloroaromatic compound transport system substrate-binding protein
MQRRKFIKTAGVGAAGAVAASTVAAPAIAQSMPSVKWRLTSSFPKSLDTLYGGAELFSKALAEMSDGKFEVRAFASGEIVPGLQVADAVQNGTVEAGQTAAYYYFGKHPNFVFETGLPFSINQRQLYAWLQFGGGSQLINEFYKEYNFRSFIFGGTGCQMGGWFRKEIKSMDDMKGLKFRVGGFAGLILERLGVVPQQIAGGDIYPALEKGTIDACEWVGPYDDEKLGFNKVAKYYYYPGWWEGSAQLSIYVNAKQWASLPKPYQEALEVACAEANVNMLARYDARNTEALRKLVSAGAQLRALPVPVMDACYKVAQDLYAELASKNADFKKIYEAWGRFRDEQYLWFRVAENTYDNFVYSVKRPGNAKK